MEDVVDGFVALQMFLQIIQCHQIFQSYNIRISFLTQSISYELVKGKKQ